MSSYTKSDPKQYNPQCSKTFYGYNQNSETGKEFVSVLAKGC